MKMNPPKKIQLYFCTSCGFKKKFIVLQFTFSTGRFLELYAVVHYTWVMLPIEHFHHICNNDVTGFTSTRVEHREITGVQLVYREDGSG